MNCFFFSVIIVEGAILQDFLLWDEPEFFYSFFRVFYWNVFPAPIYDFRIFSTRYSFRDSSRSYETGIFIKKNILAGLPGMISTKAHIKILPCIPLHSCPCICLMISPEIPPETLPSRKVPWILFRSFSRNSSKDSSVNLSTSFFRYSSEIPSAVSSEVLKRILSEVHVCML